MRNDFNENYLVHWGIKKGEKAKNHKYFERVEKNGKYIYFYTQAEYEAWLHGGNKALEKAGKKAKNALSDLKNKFGKKKETVTKVANTKSSLLNAIAKGKEAAYQLANRSSTRLTKQNASKVIDRGTKAINSLISQSSSKASAAVNGLRSNTKDISAKAQKKVQAIANRVSNTLQKAGKDTQKAVQKYVSKGEQTINSVLSKAGNVKISSTKKVGGVGTAIIASILATAAVAAIVTVAKKVYDKVQEEKRHQRELWNEYIETAQDEEAKRKEAEGRKKEIEARNKAREVEQRRQEAQDKFSNDAEGSVKEDFTHTDIPIKEEATSKNDDMMAVNQANLTDSEAFEKYEKASAEYEKYWDLYEQTGEQKYFDLAEKAYAEASTLYMNNYGFMNNCANCTLTYDLRRRGYDVDAPWNHEGTQPETITDWYKMDPEKDVEYWQSSSDSNWASERTKPFSKEQSAEIVQSMTEQYPEGAYGHFMVYWSNGGGHDCVWSKEGGKIIIRDCQTGEIVNPHEYIQKSYDVSYFRADDKELSDLVYENVMAETVNDQYQNIDNDDYEQRKRKKYEEWKYNWD